MPYSDLCHESGCLEASPLRLLIIGSRGAHSQYGGFETLSFVLQTRLPGISVVVFEVPTPTPNQSRIASIKGKYLELIVTSFRLSNQITSNQSDRYLILNPVNIFLALWYRREWGQILIHMDGRDDLRGKWPLPVRWLYRWCQRLCVLSGFPLVFDSRTVREEIGGRNWQKHVVVRYGGCQACEQNRMAWQASNCSRTFVTLARAEPENQLVEIVRSVTEMAAPVSLRVITTTRHKGRYWNSLVTEVNESLSAELIDGIWDKEQLCSMYREVSAVIHGHTVGGTNPSLVLALCHGTPVFAHDNPYNREVAGSLARYWKDEQELTKLLDEFDPATWPYDQATVDDFNRRYNWDDVVEKYKRLLGLDQSPSPGPLDRK